jgi:polyferredoxin
MSKIRKLYQSIFLIFSFYIFTADTALGESAVKFFHSLHVFPSLNAAFSGHGSRWMAVTLMLLLLTAFFGRFYCSFLCPVGFLQDILSAVSKRMRIKPGRVTNYPRLRVFMLFFTVFLALFNTGLWGWLDHFSIFGRLTNGFAIPAVNFILSPLEPYLNKTNYFQIEGSSAQAGFDFYYSILFIAALLAVSAFRPRWFCNTLCPSGALFGLIFKSGFMKIKLSPPCPGCKKCERNCPSGSIADGRVDYSTCVTCFECVKICPKDILKVSFRRTEANAEIFPEPKETSASGTRRAFITNIAAVAAGIVSAGYSSKLALAFDNVRKIACVIPPGAGTAYNFFSKCSACHMCISNCPSKVLKPALLENGFVGLSKPRMDFEKSYCGFECNICTGVCPSGALTYLPLAKKQTTAVGKVVLDTSAKTECIPYKNNTDCGSCAEHCPTGAVYMVRQGDVFVPRIRRAFCNGCGACEHVCPVAGAGKPIRVVPFPRHIPVQRLADIQDKIKKAPDAKAPDAPAKGVEDAKPSGGTGGFPF